MVLPHDLETLEAVSQNEAALDLFLRVAYLAGDGQLNRFLLELGETEGIDDETKAAFAEVAQDEAFLRALDEYVYRTSILH
jgi:hypothetical protein